MHRLLESLKGALFLLWNALDLTRRLVVNVVFLFLAIAILGMLIFEDGVKIEKSSALVVSPSGLLVEQSFGDERENAILNLTGRARNESLMKTLLESIERAADDERIEVLVLNLDKMGGAGLSKLMDLKGAVETFKASGKPVIAMADYYTQSRYLLATSADEIYLHPMGMVMLTGFGSYRNYYKDALDYLGVEWNVFRVGEYKSSPEPYIRNDMSPEARESRLHWLTNLWDDYKASAAGSRGLDPEDIQQYVETFHLRLPEHGGSAAQLALAAGLVDKIANRDEVRDRLIELVGEDEEIHSFRQIGYLSYLESLGPEDEPSKNEVAVVVAKGPIFDGTRQPGVIGGDSTARLIRRARQSESVKALVLRVDSPGGSTFASEIIRREVELTREAGIPVIASMGSVAASGGYWISMSANEIWASPGTITGSIGIYAMMPTFSQALAKLKIRNDGVGTTPLAGTLRPERDLPVEAATSLQLMIDQGYRDFITRVAENRKMTVEEVDAVARGRVWVGAEAKDLGLIDRMGSLEEALEAAAEMAEIGDDYSVRYFERESTWTDRLLAGLVARTSTWIGPAAEGVADELAGRVPVPRWMKAVGEEFFAHGDFDDPRGMFSYCFCEID